MASMKIVVLLAFAWTCALCKETEANLPSLRDPGQKEDPYELDCVGGGYGCENSPKTLVLPKTPLFCFFGYCSYVEYINTPWSSEGGLVIQPVCRLPVGNKVIPPGKLRLSIFFFTGHVNKIVQWSFKRLLPNLYTNDQTIYGAGEMEFQFQVFYSGSVTYWPHYVYTPAPLGLCIYNIAL